MLRASLVWMPAAVLAHTGALPAPAQAPDRYAVIPRPATLVPVPGELALGPGVRTVFEPTGHPALRAAASWWLDDVRAASGLPLAEMRETDDVAGGTTRLLRFRLDPGLETGEEGYRLHISPEGLLLEAATVAGVFYGAQTLRQLSPLEGERSDVTLPAVRIEDAPRFPYRGLHLDVGRHMFPVGFIKRYIDLLARFKLNTFHWHLTEDQGWRIEIERYPRLTEIGAWRGETMVGKNFDPYLGDGERYGGFYTREEVREVVAHAAARHVTVIPEIEMPGHSLAALAAYPELACTEGPFEVGTRWGVYEDIYCPTEATFEFLENVLLEVMDLFPSRYIHIGGDEAPKTRWRESGSAQAVMREHGLESEDELQSWFIRRIGRFLDEHGRRLIGWDEILEGGLPPDATVMSWRGTAGGIEAAHRGHDVVMTPNSHLYFDYYQSLDRTREPLAIGGYTPIEKVYAYEPVPAALDREASRHVLGAQANVWTEYIRTPEHVEYMVYPRALALAEVVWTPRERRSWDDFAARLPTALARLDGRGVRYRIPDVQGLAGERLSLENRAYVRLSSPLPDAVIRYTLDGTDPRPDSPRYAGPIELTLGREPAEVRARLFLAGGRAGPVSEGRFVRAAPIEPVDVDPETLSAGLRYEIAPGGFRSVAELAGAGLERRGRFPEPGYVDSFSDEAFGLRFSGYIEVPEDGVYTFHLLSDDGSRLSIAGETVIDHDGPHAASERSGQVALAAGRHPVELLYFEAGGGEALSLEVTPPEGERGSIPRGWWSSPD